MKLPFFITLLFLVQSHSPCAQATFSPFTGTVYDLFDYDQSKGYRPAVLTFDVMGKITLPELNVKRVNQFVKYFPGVNQRDMYGIIFTSTLTVQKEGCYEFYLESDDGSILWIEDHIVIDNDSLHKMKVMRDTLTMKPGAYPVKVWYYNGLPAELGLILKVNLLHDSIPCPIEKRQFVLNDILFDVNSHTLNADGQKELDQFIRFLNATAVNTIRVVGHTDNTGTAVHNKALSLKRAETVASYIQPKLISSCTLETFGAGYDEPLSRETDPESQKMNRRVEIIIQ